MFADKSKYITCFRECAILRISHTHTHKIHRRLKFCRELWPHGACRKANVGGGDLAGKKPKIGRLKRRHGWMEHQGQQGASIEVRRARKRPNQCCWWWGVRSKSSLRTPWKGLRHAFQNGARFAFDSALFKHLGNSAPSFTTTTTAAAASAGLSTNQSVVTLCFGELDTRNGCSVLCCQLGSTSTSVSRSYGQAVLLDATLPGWISVSVTQCYVATISS